MVSQRAALQCVGLPRLTAERTRYAKVSKKVARQCAGAPRSVRSSHAKKRRSSERRNEKP